MIIFSMAILLLQVISVLYSIYTSVFIYVSGKQRTLFNPVAPRKAKIVYTVWPFCVQRVKMIYLLSRSRCAYYER